MSAGVNRGIFEAYRYGIVTSASLMVRWLAAAEAVAEWRELPAACSTGLSLGLHVDLGEWFFRDGCWQALYEVAPASDTTAVQQEVHRQLDLFRELTGQNPTHFDSHQHVHLKHPLHKILRDVAAELSVPLRSVSRHARYCGSFYGQSTRGDSLPEAISPAALIRILDELPAGVTELGCHPGYAGDLQTMYRLEREVEVQTLCDAAVRMALDEKQIKLYSWADIPLPVNPK